MAARAQEPGKVDRAPASAGKEGAAPGGRSNLCIETYPEGWEGPECEDVEHWWLYKNPFRYLGQICQFGAKKFKKWNLLFKKI